MRGLILAGGEGSRMRRGGVSLPKPLIEIGGRPQVVRLLETLESLGCAPLACVVRADFPEVVALLEHRRSRTGARLVVCRTPSSLHSLARGLTVLPPGPVFCAMVDTVMQAGDWRVVHTGVQRHLAAGADAVLAVTPFVDDESPLYVARSPDGLVSELGAEPPPCDSPCVTGGVYGFSARARLAAVRALARGRCRMRGFLQFMASEGLRIATVEVPRIIDVDRPADLELANALLARQGPEPR